MDLSVELREKALLVAARKAEPEADSLDQRRFLHRGIATRAFERRFHLADLVREGPEALKPRRIEIAKLNPASTPLVEATAVI